MVLPIALFAQLAGACAGQVAPRTLAAVAATESRFDSLAVFDSTTHTAWRPRDRGEAIALAWRLIGAGHAVDLGLMQIDSSNLARLHLAVPRAFEPCASLRAGAAVLAADYKLARVGSGAPPMAEQRALRVAFSRYNTGSAVRGFENGYVSRVVAAARYVVPEIAVDPAPAAPKQAVPQKSATPDWQVFDGTAGAAAAADWNVFPQSAGPGRLPGSSMPANPARGGQHE